MLGDPQFIECTVAHMSLNKLWHPGGRRPVQQVPADPFGSSEGAVSWGLPIAQWPEVD